MFADAATFAKAKTLLRHRNQDPVGPSQREQRAQLRAQRLEQKAAKAYRSQEADNVLEDADAHEAAASLVDLMAHEALQETGKAATSTVKCHLDGCLHKTHLVNARFDHGVAHFRAYFLPLR